MPRFVPFLLAIVATLFAVSLTLVLMRPRTAARQSSEVRWRRLFGRTLEKAADAVELEATE